MQNKLLVAVVKTLIYSDIFDFPLTASEIHRYLIEGTCTQAELSELLYPNSLATAKPPRLKINQWQGVFYLGRKKWAVRQRIQREKIAKTKLNKARKLTAVLKLVPWIKMVAVTGRVAALNSCEDDDIDLMIVTAKNRLWLARFLEFLLLTLLGRRRRPRQTKNLKDKLCPNLYISEEDLEFPQRDLFTANELARIRPVWEKNQTYRKLIQANAWAKEFLPNWWQLNEKRAKNRKHKVGLEAKGSKIEKENGSNKGRSAPRLIFRDLSLNTYPLPSILNFLERLARFLQLKYMQPRQTKEVVQDNLLMFHPGDVRKEVLEEYQRKVEQAG